MQLKNKPFFYHSQARHGFSLVELMIVLAILVLLAGLVLPRLLGQQNKADIKATQTQINSFKQALQNYAIDVRTYPDTESGLKALVAKPENEQQARKWDGSYIEEIPVDPWGNAYNYEYPPTKGGRDFPNIWSNGPDGESETDDDIKNWTESEEEGQEGDGANSEGAADKDNRSKDL
ncbi:MAG: type II secretion system major pseudopilin GspG [Planctomycetaceae bacterium]|nr:type II secretion system major pseudopilin GspG [Planctomycetaceae bacterium]